MDYLAPMVLHLFLGTIVKLWDLLVSDVRKIDNVDDAAIETLAQLREALDFVAGLREDVKNAETVVDDESKAGENLYAEAKKRLNENHISIGRARALEAGISESDFDAAQQLKKLRGEATERAKVAKEELATLKAELKLYEDLIARLQEKKREPGSSEVSLESFLKFIKVRFVLTFTDLKDTG